MVEMASLDTFSKSFRKPVLSVNHCERRISGGYVYSKVLFQSDIKTTGATPLSDLSLRSQTCHYIRFTSLISKVVRMAMVGYTTAALLCWGEFAMLHEINNADFWNSYFEIYLFLNYWDHDPELCFVLRNISLRKRANMDKCWGVQSVTLVFQLSRGGD